jgi:Tol biopolymer transport system component
VWTRLPVWVLAAAALARADPALAQYLFGQNKVIYSAKDWQVISTPRLDVYYYAGEQELAEYVADFSERTAIEYEEFFHHKFDHKIPLILYSSHHDFKQTNVIDLMISEYVGGFTEFIRGRVAIPHTGSWTQLREVTRHELTHAFMNDKLASVMAKKHRYNYSPPPLWFTEGLAEYVAMPEAQTEARMFMRDFIVNENLVDLQNLWRIEGSFLMYKEGESLVRYIASRFGNEALVQLLEDWWYSDRFDIVFHHTLGMTAEDLNRDWRRALKRRYYPAVMTAEWPETYGKDLTHARGINSRPAIIPASAATDGSYDFVYLSSASGNVDVLRSHPSGTEHRLSTRIIEGGRGENVESIPAFSSGPEVHGSQLAFTAKSGECDALFIWDLERNQQVAKLKFPSLITLSTPSWSPDGNEIVLSGLDHSGWADLYRVELASGRLTRLTFDAAHDRDPDWSHDGRRIAWSSDRAAPEQNGVYGLWVLDLDSGRLVQLTSGTHDDAAPAWSPDDRQLLFSSDLDGANNIYWVDVDSGKLTQVTSTLGGLFTPQWTPDGRHFIASSFSNLAFNIYQFDLQHGRELPETTTPPPVEVAAAGAAVPEAAPESPSGWGLSGKVQEYPKRKYDTRFGLDFVHGGVAYDPDFMSAAGAQVGFTDVLGNHRVGVLVASSSDEVQEFIKQLNVGVTYTNLTRRLNYTVGGFHLTRTYDPNLDVFRFERRIGALLGLSYPLSRFRRIETSFVARTANLEESDARILGVGQNSVLFSNYTSLVHDNTMWSFVGPMDGTRYNITLGRTFDFTGSGRTLTSALLDYRKYNRLPSSSVFATRLILHGNWGGDAQYFFMGGPFDMRGFSRRSLFSRKSLLINNELRFPLVNRLLIGLPFNAIELGGFRGIVFNDATYQGGPFTPGWYGSYGVGVEMGLGVGFIVRWNAGYTHNFERTLDSFQQFYLGWDF